MTYLQIDFFCEKSRQNEREYGVSNYRFACCTWDMFAVFSDSGIVIEIIGSFPVAFGDGLWAFPWVCLRFIFAVSAVAIASVPTVITPISFYIR